MKTLMQIMIKVKYDLKEFQKVIYHTYTYQSQSFNRDLKSGEKYYFQGPLLRRIGAEQVWDSLLVLMKEDVDRSVGPMKSLKHEKLYSLYKNKKREEVYKSAEILAADVIARKENKPNQKLKADVLKNSERKNAYQIF